MKLTKGQRKRRRLGMLEEKPEYVYDMGLVCRFSEWVKENGMFCFYCGVNLRGGKIVREHVWPRNRGGVHTAPSCKPCDMEKGRYTLSEYKRKLGIEQIFAERIYAEIHS